MRLRRIAAAAAACAAIASLSLACTAIIGGIGADDHVDAVATMCSCNEELEFLGVRASCEQYLTKRFEGLTAEERQDWLTAYEAGCQTCQTVKGCFYREPICKSVGCTLDEECCNYPDGGVCNAGKCF